MDALVSVMNDIHGAPRDDGGDGRDRAGDVDAPVAARATEACVRAIRFQRVARRIGPAREHGHGHEREAAGEREAHEARVARGTHAVRRSSRAEAVALNRYDVSTRPGFERPLS